MTIYTGRERQAALILLNETPLGRSVPWGTDDDGVLTIKESAFALSSGELAIDRLVRELADFFGTLNEINRSADDACKSAVLRSLAALFGATRCPVHLADGPLCCTQAQGHEGGHTYEGSSCPQRGDTEAVQS